MAAGRTVWLTIWSPTGGCASYCPIISVTAAGLYDSLISADQESMVRIVGALPFWSLDVGRDGRDQELREHCAGVLWIRRRNLPLIHVVRLPAHARRHP